MNAQSSNGKPRLALLGLAHVGLPTTLGSAELDWEAVGADYDARVKSAAPGLMERLDKVIE